jgi:low temperature requirement protein LtrA
MPAVLWVAGGLLEGEGRYTLWVLAVVLEYTGPVAGFWTPGLGRSTTADWTVEGGHFAERCRLFVILALGKSILVTGTTFAEIEPFGSQRIGIRSGLSGHRGVVVALLRPQRRGRP